MAKEWLFLLTDKGTEDAAWWLKITSHEQLLRYLKSVDGKYGRAYQNWLQDKEYQPGSVTHGKYPGEARLTLLAHCYGLNRDLDIVSSLMNLKADTDTAMMRALDQAGQVFINCCGGWNTGQNGQPYGQYDGDFVRTEKPVWPSFGTADIRLSQFPGGEHWYASIGPVEVRNLDGGLRFHSRTEARDAARRYITQT